MSIVLVGSTSGSITLQEPAVAGSTVLDLPATSGTLITTGSSGQSIPKAALPTGSVLQVVQGTLVTVASTSSSSFVTTGLSATITPTSSSSKILIFFSGLISSVSVGDSTFLTIYRGASNIGTGTGSPNNSFARQYTASTVTGFSASINYLDSPATTSSTTYTLYFASDGTGTVYLNRIGSNQTSIQPSFITLMEIAA